MARIAGVTTQKDRSGNPTHITINLTKHPEAVAALKSVGLMEKSDLRKEVEANPDNFMTVEDARIGSIEHLRSIWPK
jgi:mRNA-degrading endonuclease toxin of MazEF toxin-antitoxin module